MKRQPETRHASLVLSSFPTTFVSTIPPPSPSLSLLLPLSVSISVDPPALALFVRDGICVLRRHQDSSCFLVDIVGQEKSI